MVSFAGSGIRPASPVKNCKILTCRHRAGLDISSEPLHFAARNTMIEASDKANASKRLFIAIWIPSNLIQRVEEIQCGLKCGLGDALAWTRKDQLHLTLRFFGNVSDADFEPLLDAISVSAKRFAPIEAALEGLGCFPNRRNPRILWIGIQDRSGQLAHLHSNLAKETGAFGSPPDAKPFRAHLTIARTRTRRTLDRDQREFLNQFDAPNLGEWTASEISLVKSSLSLRGSCYTIKRSFLL